jgi:CobQ-like glutamine amidotransferase family enzyme
MPKFTILHLYPNTLHLNGEVGNVLALVERGKASGLEVTVQEAELGENLSTAKPDLIFIGSGILSAVKVASADLEKKASKILEWVQAGTKVLAVGAGFDLISKGLEVEHGQILFGLGLTDTSHRVTGNHLVGEVVADNGLAGFINWNREIVRSGDDSNLATVLASDESRLVGYRDGYRSGNIIATNIQGPFLPMNPSIADELLGIAGEASERNAMLNQLAEKAREAISRRVNR